MVRQDDDEHLPANMRWLEKYIESRIDALQALLEARFTALDAEIKLARQNMDLRMEGTNEWRGTVQDYTTKLALKSDLDRVERDLQEVRLALTERSLKLDHDKCREDISGRVNALDKLQAVIAGKASLGWLLISTGISIVALILALFEAMKG